MKIPPKMHNSEKNQFSMATLSVSAHKSNFSLLVVAVNTATIHVLCGHRSVAGLCVFWNNFLAGLAKELQNTRFLQSQFVWCLSVFAPWALSGLKSRTEQKNCLFLKIVKPLRILTSRRSILDSKFERKSYF